MVHELIQVTDRVWYYPFEVERDRPMLGYIRGDRFSVAIDAGHSDEHVQEFYTAIKNAGLPLPSVTLLTHWHWDHTFGIHAIQGVSIANSRTNEYLEEFIREMPKEGYLDKFRHLDPGIWNEYGQDKPIIVQTADVVYDKKLTIDAGGIIIHTFREISSHTDDCSLIYLPQEKIVFLGDAMSGEFPEWVVTPDKMEALIRSIESLDTVYCLNGHWEEQKTEEVLARMRASM